MNTQSITKESIKDKRKFFFFTRQKNHEERTDLEEDSPLYQNNGEEILDDTLEDFSPSESRIFKSDSEHQPSPPDSTIKEMEPHYPGEPMETVSSDETSVSGGYSPILERWKSHPDSIQFADAEEIPLHHPKGQNSNSISQLHPAEKFSAHSKAADFKEEISIPYEPLKMHPYLEKFIELEKKELQSKIQSMIEPFYRNNLHIDSKPVDIPDADKDRLNNVVKKLILLTKSDIVLDSPTYNKLAYYLWNNGYFEDALKILESNLPKNNQLNIANNLLGILYVRMEQYNKSIEVFEANLGSKTHYVSTCYSLGMIYYLREEFEKAIDFFERIESEFNQDLKYLEAIGQSYYKLGDDNKALKHFQQILRKDPKNQIVTEYTGDILYRSKNFDEAQILLEKLREKQNDFILYRLAVCYYYTNHQQQCIQILAALTRNEETFDQSIPTKLTILDFFLDAYHKKIYDNNLFEVCYQLLVHETKDRVLYFQKKIGPVEIPHLLLQYLIAEANLDLQNYHEAIQLLEKLKSKYPSDSRILRYLAKAYMATDNVDSAMKLLHTLEEMGEMDSEINYLVGKGYFFQNQFSKCCEKLEVALTQQFFEKDIYIFLGFSYFQDKDFGKAINFYKKYLIYDPNNLNVKNDLGVVYCESGDYDNAILTFRSILKTDVHNKDAHFNLSQTYKLILERASEEHLEQYVELTKSSPTGEDLNI